MASEVSKEINTVDPQLAKELLLKAVYAVAISSVLICLYAVFVSSGVLPLQRLLPFFMMLLWLLPCLRFSALK